MKENKISDKGTSDGHLITCRTLSPSNYKKDLELLQCWLDGEYPDGWYQAWHMKDNGSGTYGSVAFCFMATVKGGAVVPIAEPIIVRLKGMNDPHSWTCDVYRRGGTGRINLAHEFNKQKK